VLLADVELILGVAIENGEGGNGVGAVAVQVTCEYDASCLCHADEYAARRTTDSIRVNNSHFRAVHICSPYGARAFDHIYGGETLGRCVIAAAVAACSTGLVGNQEALGESHHHLLAGGPESSREVRRTVSEVLRMWGCDGLVEDAVLAAAELASNAILHAGGDFELVVRPLQEGARIEIIDRRPDLVPTAVPVAGNAPAPRSESTIGRGLKIVAILASRWGYTTSASSKSVWIEVTEPLSTEPTEPIVVEGHHESTDPAARMFHFESIPVRAAVSSGVHVEELIREIQLASQTAAIDEAESASVRELLDLSASARLHGRHAAFTAAAKGQPRFSIDVRMSPEAIVAFGELNAMLAEASSRIGAAAVRLPSEVIEFRGWFVEELARQASGQPPAPCPLPD
jgi:anti-sigma regulatory factor (Ser/Thr protein kinase)